MIAGQPPPDALGARNFGLMRRELTCLAARLFRDRRREVVIRLTVEWFLCANPDCAVPTFAEQVGGLRRHLKRDEVAVGFALGNNFMTSVAVSDSQ